MNTMNFSKILALLFLVNITTSSAVISIDFGGQFIKIGIIQNGKTPTVVLNGESSRKIPAVYYHKGTERLFGNAAMAKIVKNRKNTYIFIRDLLGKTANDPAVENYLRRFPYYNLGEDKAGNLFFKGQNELYVEEIAAYILRNALEMSEEYAETSITQVTISIPAYFGPSERAAMIRVAKIAGITSPELVSESACILTEYVILNRKSEDKEWKDLALLDVGASKTALTIFSYRPQNGSVNAQSFIKSIGWDMTFGVVDVIICLRDYIIELFLETNAHISREEVEKDDKFMGKIFVQAEKSLHILSSNTAAKIFTENIYGDAHLDVMLHRTKFEDRLLATSQISSALARVFIEQQDYLTNVSQVVLFGAGTRIPLVQSTIKSFNFKVLSTLNTDEATATGGVYRTASLSSLFRVIPFSVEDAWVHTLIVKVLDVEKEFIFPNQALPIKRLLRFTNSTISFPFNLLVLAGGEPLMNTTINYSEPKTGTFEALKVHFLVDSSGFLQVTKAEMEVRTLQEVNETVASQNLQLENASKEEKPENVTQILVLKNVTSLLPLEFYSEWFHFTGLGDDLVDLVIQRIDDYSKADQLKNDKNQLKNLVEATCFSLKNNMQDKFYEQFLTESEREHILSVISTAFDWLDMVAEGDSIEEYQKMNQELTDASKGWNFRCSEFLARPRTREMFAKIIKEFNDKSKLLKEVFYKIESGNFTFDKEFLSLEEIEQFENKTTEFYDWFIQQDSLQNSTALTDDPVWSVKEFEIKARTEKIRLDAMRHKFSNFIYSAKKLDKKTDVNVTATVNATEAYNTTGTKDASEEDTNTFSHKRDDEEDEL